MDTLPLPVIIRYHLVIVLIAANDSLVDIA